MTRTNESRTGKASPIRPGAGWALAVALVCLSVAAQAPAAEKPKAFSLGTSLAQNALAFDPFALTVARTYSVEAWSQYVRIGWRWVPLARLRTALQAELSLKDQFVRKLVTSPVDTSASGLPFLVGTPTVFVSGSTADVPGGTTDSAGGSPADESLLKVSDLPADGEEQPGRMANLLMAPSGSSETSGDRPPIRVPYRPPLRSPYRPPL